MPATGVLLIPLLPGNVSIASKLTEHLSHRYPESEHREFTLEYRLFSDTSSQLPGSDVSQRSFTHVFASSHDPERGYLRATRPGQADDGESITIARESIESFVNLTLTKLQPIWYHRQHLSIEEGASVSLKAGEWIISIGDVRMASRTGGSSTLRGTIVEVYRTQSEEDDHEEQNTKLQFRDVLDKIFSGTGESFGEADIAVAETLPRVSSARKGRAADWSLARTYMKVLRGQR